jgi:hypothetical protein
MNRLLNTQYTKFILEQVVRPYQGMLGYEQRIERLMFVRTSEPTSFNYAALIIYCNTRVDWFHMVLNRLSKCYEGIDFSFFPNEAFAHELQMALIGKGVKSINYYCDDIYANSEG